MDGSNNSGLKKLRKLGYDGVADEIAKGLVHRALILRPVETVNLGVQFVPVGHPANENRQEGAEPKDRRQTDPGLHAPSIAAVGLGLGAGAVV